MFSLFTARRISLLVIAGYALVFLLAARTHSVSEVLPRLLPIAAYFLLPILCIWYGDEMGDYVGMLPGPAINMRTPGWMVKIAGWFLLLLPAIIFVFVSPIS